RADVNAKLQRVRRHHAADRAVAQAMLDRAPLGWEVATAIAADEIGWPLRLRETRAKIGEQQLGLHARARERDRLHARGEQRRGDVATDEERALAHAKVAVDDGRVDEHEDLLAARGAGLVDDDDVVLDVMARE